LLESSFVGWAVATVVVSFVFGWWDVSDGLQDPVVVEPVDPFQRGVLDVVEAPPLSPPSDDFGLVETVDRLGHPVVKRIDRY